MKKDVKKRLSIKAESIRALTSVQTRDIASGVKVTPDKTCWSAIPCPDIE
jgi:hypothetical protein